MPIRMALGVVLALALCARAGAVPGQTLQTVCAWAKHTPKLAEVECSGGMEGEIPYLSAVVRQPPWSTRLVFESHPNSRGTIVREVLRYTHAPDATGLSFTRTGSNGLQLLQIFYGAGIAADFATSTMLSDADPQVFKGKRFYYAVSTFKQHDDTQPTGHEDTVSEQIDITLSPPEPA